MDLTFRTSRFRFDPPFPLVDDPLAGSGAFGLTKQDLAGSCGEFLHLRDDRLKAFPVGDPGSVELSLSEVEAPAERLAVHRPAPLVVGAMALRWVRLAAASHLAA